MTDNVRPPHRNAASDMLQFAGRLIAVLPSAPLDLALQAVADRIISAQPEAFSRLCLERGTLYRIAATDVGIAFLVTVKAQGVRVKTAPAARPLRAHVSIEAPIGALIALLEGESDGDALFFARDIQVTGDTGALLMLRNAVDSADIDFRTELLALLGPLAPAGRHVATAGLSAGNAVINRGRQLQAWLQARPLAELARLETRIGQLEHDLRSLQQGGKPGVPRRKRPERAPIMRVENPS